MKFRMGIEVRMQRRDGLKNKEGIEYRRPNQKETLQGNGLEDKKKEKKEGKKFSTIVFF